MTENIQQLRLWHWRNAHGHKMIVPNSQLFYGESDLLSVAKSGFAYTHEIKCTRSDFQNEFKNRRKKIWHQHLLEAFEGNSNFIHRLPNYYLFVCEKRFREKRTPNLFVK